MKIDSSDVAAFICGFVGLSTQILAGRLLAPYFGNSVYTWGSIIGVFMLCLGIGYFHGGRLSTTIDAKKMSQYVLCMGAIIALLAFLGDRLALQISQIEISPTFAALPAVLLLFGPSSYLIGLISPGIVELSRHAHKGHAASRTFSLDTVGSVLGIFLTTFLLIPLTSLTTSFVILGFICVMGALLIHRGVKNYIIGTIIAISLILILFLMQTKEVVQGEGPLYISMETAYQRLEVKDERNRRTLYLDGQQQSAMDLRDPYRHVFTYTKSFHIPLFMEDVRSALFIGGGGFTGPKIFARRNITVDVIELDAAVADVGRKYFYANDSEMDIHIGDARQFLSRSDDAYDVIILDAYRKDKVPFHLATQEFYEVVYDKLPENGILVSNIIAAPSGSASVFFRTTYKTMDSVFDGVYAFGTRNDDGTQNIVLVATKKTKMSSDELRWLYEATDVGVDLSTALSLEIREIQTEDVELLTDAHAPVDTLLRSLIKEVPIAEE